MSNKRKNSVSKTDKNFESIMNFINDFVIGFKNEILDSNEDEKIKEQHIKSIDDFVSDFKSKMNVNNQNEIQRFIIEFLAHNVSYLKNKKNNQDTDFELDSVTGIKSFDESKIKPSQLVPMDEQTFGEKAVGLSFNPSAIDEVTKCKSAYAKLIDEMNDLRAISDSQEQKRLCSVAITELQTAQMWSVKALTWKD